MDAVAMEVLDKDSRSSIPEQKQVWRIGTISMGITLIGIGLSFATSLWQETSAYELMLWLAPIVFIMLGIELLISIKLNRSNRYKVTYDWLSLWFVAIVGAGAILMSILFYTGVAQEINHAMNTKERSFFVDEQTLAIESSVKKIVVSSSIPVTIDEHNNLEAVHLTGTIRYEAKEVIAIRDQQLLNTKQLGDVLYVFVQNIEHKSSGIFDDRVYPELVLAVPSGLIVE